MSRIHAAAEESFRMNKDETATYSVIERLRDGRSVTIRAIRSDDKGLVSEALRDLSADSIYRRLFYAKKEFGIASRIFGHLVAIARESGITQFEAEILPSNEAMLKVFTRSGIPVTKRATCDSVHILMDLTGEDEH